MPGGDGTGPGGMGPMTGRAAGYCAGYAAPGFASRFGGGGFGAGRGGGGRGWRNRFYATGMYGWQRAMPGWPAFGGWGSTPAPAGAVPYGPGITREQELATLEAQASQLEQTLAGIRQRIEQMGAAPAGT